METSWQNPDDYASAVLFPHSTVFYTGNSAFVVPKVVATRSEFFLLLLLPVYGSLIDTTNADRYRWCWFIELASYMIL